MADDVFTIQERVATACHASNLRDESGRASTTDILKAMAWSKSRLGSALMRLVSEFEAIPKPKPLSHDQLVSLALTMTGSPKEKEEKAKAEAAKWLANEKSLFLPRLKTLSVIVQQMGMRAEKWQISKPEHFAVVCIGHWLSSVCPKCHGVKNEKIANTPSTSAKNCNTGNQTDKL